MRELLRDPTSPGHAGDVDLCVTELRNETGGKPRQRRRAIRQEWPGDPPTPGTSKMIALVLVSASRNGFANSQLAPIPLNSTSGGPLPLPCLIAT